MVERVGSVTAVWRGWGLGMLVPLALSWRKQWLGDLNITTVAALVLLGGFLLRVVIVFAAEGV